MHTTALHVAGTRRQAPSQPSPAAGQGQEPPRERHGRALAAALGYLFALEVTGLIFMWTRHGQKLDGRLVAPVVGGGGYLEQNGPAAGPAHALLSLTGNTVVLTVLVLLVLLAGALSRRLLAAFAGVAAAGCSVAAAAVLKLAVPRPDFGIDGSTSSSFPSGHVAAATGLVLALMLALPARARRWLVIPGAAAISAVASATMIIGWHRFSDVLGGILLASMMCALAAALLGRRGAVGGSAGAAAGAGAGGRGGRGLAGGRFWAGGVGPGRRNWAAGAAAAVGPALCVIAAALSVHPGPLTAVMLVTGFSGLSMLAMTLVLHPVRPAPAARREADPDPPGQLSGSGR
jgi:membrane-associated phospholipid phosphatase